MADLNAATPLALAIDPSAVDAGMGVYVPDHPDLIIMQYTGLKDANDKDIYEGDVIRGNLKSWSVMTMGQVIYSDDLCGWANRNEAGDTMLYKISKFEVLGNVHENPELLVKQGGESHE